ncbi:hypothetical protein FOA52_000439 [Chlamydomonas sp. UWO 241]|nr:hypothetical protein FOA52_000439 [Chlamydomonas sp. UWO 241]
MEQSLVSVFEARTGWQVIIDFVALKDVVPTLISAENGPLPYDGWIADSSTFVDVMTSIAPIDSFIREDDTLHWSDVTKFVRESSTYEGGAVGVPVSRNSILLYYRTDVFSAAGLAGAPTTWDDVLLAAKSLNGSDFNRDGIADHALCVQLDECADGAWSPVIMASVILASMTQAAGPKTGFLFDPQTMKSFVGSAAMEAALQLLQELLRYSSASSGCAMISPLFVGGSCAITISIDSLFKQVQRESSFSSVVGVAKLPGSTRVLDRQAGQLHACTRELCPYAALECTYGGHAVLINRAPCSIDTFGFVNARQEPLFQQAVFDHFSFLSEPTSSKRRVMDSLAIGPFRTSHLDTSAASLAEWSDAGYEPAAVKELLELLQQDVAHPNTVMNLRMRGDSAFLNALQPAIRNALAGMAPVAIASHLAAEFDAILARSGPISDIRASLWAGLGIRQPGTPPPPLWSGAWQGDGNTGSQHVGVIVGVSIAAVVLLLLVLTAAFFVMHRSKLPLFGRYWIPAAGDDTTLVVTDIMDSTALWEMLDAGGMSRAVATHHAVVRKVLARFHGYEQATEGDSFLLAFHTSSDALGFAVQMQAGLLSADWEPELLAHSACAPVAMAPSAALLGTGGSASRFLVSAAAVLLGRDRISGAATFMASACLRASSDGAGTSSQRLSDVGSFMSPPLSAFFSMGSTGGVAARVAGGGAVTPVINGAGRHTVGVSAAFGAPSDPPSPTGMSIQWSPSDLHDDPIARPPVLSMLSQKGSMRVRASPGDSFAPRGAPVPASLRPCVSPDGTHHDACTFELEHAVSLIEDVQAAAAVSESPGTATVTEYVELAFVETDARAPKEDKAEAVVVFRGLRVRVGMHSGVSKTDIERNSTAGRMFFTGLPLVLAKAVGDAGAGGMILLTQDAFERLNPARTLDDVLLLCMGDHQVKGDLGVVCLYQAIERPLVPRLAAFEALRDVERLQLSVLDAPVGSNVTIAFVNMVGLATLQAWNKDQASRALAVFVALSTRLLMEAEGYLVELTSAGLCLAAFREPASAVAWGLCLIEVMKHAKWDEELLAHVLCEEVLVQASGSVHGASAPRVGRVLFRGPRLKIGIDVGQVQADVSPVTGRMTYRGKVMNRAARICGKASSGMQWCSAALWDQVQLTCGEQLLSTGILGTELGAHKLKGVTNSVSLVQCALGEGSAPMAAAPDVILSSMFDIHRASSRALNTRSASSNLAATKKHATPARRLPPRAASAYAGLFGVAPASLVGLDDDDNDHHRGSSSAATTTTTRPSLSMQPARGAAPRPALERLAEASAPLSFISGALPGGEDSSNAGDHVAAATGNAWLLPSHSVFLLDSTGDVMAPVVSDESMLLASLGTIARLQYSVGGATMQVAPMQHAQLAMQHTSALASLEEAAGLARGSQRPIERYMMLRGLKDRDPSKYFRILMSHQEEVLPYIYTPTVGEACERYHTLPGLTPTGLYLRCDEHVGRIAAALAAHPTSDVRVIVVTDGERILGLGDLGANGMGISEGKITLYTAAAGVDPSQCLPVCLDMGTNNQALLDDPAYKGVRRKRLAGAEFDAFVAEFMAAVRDAYPRCVVQFEDFGNSNAFRVLEAYRHKQPCFNDDIQGTAAITLAAVLAALRGSGREDNLLGNRIMFLGAGEAGTGIGQLIAYCLHRRTGIPMEEALGHCFFVDSKGLVCKSRLEGLQHHKLPFAHDVPFCGDLASAVRAIRPSVLIGVSTVAGAFTEEVVRLMAEYNDRPIIFPLSNPTSKAECTFEQAHAWSGGRVIFASGSPFEPITTAPGVVVTPAQANNAYIFPAVGGAASLMRWGEITDEMFLLAAEALAGMATQDEIRSGRLFPPFSHILDLRNPQTKRIQYIGTYISEEDAARAYDFAAVKAHGPGTKRNFPGEDISEPPVSQGEERMRRRSSHFVGVSWSKVRSAWRAQLQDPQAKRSQYIGTYSSEEDAVRAYDCAVVQAHGTDTKRNFPSKTITELPATLDEERKRRSSSQCIGVTWRKDSSSWRAQLRDPKTKRSRHIGNYASEADAARTYDFAAVRARGPETKRSRRIEAYASEEDAARAYDCAAVQAHGPGAKRNFPGENISEPPVSKGEERKRSSSYVGVSWQSTSSSWRAQLPAPQTKRSRHIGHFPSEEDAARAYDFAVAQAHGLGAKRNFPGEDISEPPETVGEMWKKRRITPN